MPNVIALNVDGVYVSLRGPYPAAVIEAANTNTQFSDVYVLREWLWRVFPDWKQHVIHSENLVRLLYV